MKKNNLVTPVLKWVGGKRQLLNTFKPLFPRKITTYCEPFLGGGAVLFDLQPKKALVNDINSDLILVYTVIRDSVDELIKRLELSYKSSLSVIQAHTLYFSGVIIKRLIIPIYPANRELNQVITPLHPHHPLQNRSGKQLSEAIRKDYMLSRSLPHDISRLQIPYPLYRAGNKTCPTHSEAFY